MLIINYLNCLKSSLPFSFSPIPWKLPLLTFTFQNLSLFSTFPSQLAHPDDTNYSKKVQTLLSLFTKCSTKREIEQIHAHMVQSGLAQNLYVVGKIIVFCAVSEQGSMDYAVTVFEKIDSPDGFLWNTMIRGFGRVNQVEKVFGYYKKMLEKGEIADNFTFSFLLKASAQCGSMVLGEQTHCNVIKHGLDRHVYVRNTLIHMYGMLKCIGIARQLFDEIPQSHLVAWNTIIDCYVYCGKHKEALDLFSRMRHSGMEPDDATLAVILSACSALGDLELGRWVHSYLDHHSNLKGDVSLTNSLIHMYAKCGEVETAYRTFTNMKTKNAVTWNAMILGFATNGRAHEALELFSRMVNEYRVSPNDVTFLGVLYACSHGGMIEEGRRCFVSMSEDYHIQPSIKHYGCMVDILGRAGFVEEAYKLIGHMPMKCNAIIWRTLLAACRVHGKVELGEKVRTHLLELEPDHSSDYVLLANTYASLGQWNDVSRLRKSMRDRGVQKLIPGNSFIGIPSKTGQREEAIRSSVHG